HRTTVNDVDVGGVRERDNRVSCTTQAIFNCRGVVLIHLAAERGEGDTHGMGDLGSYDISVSHTFVSKFCHFELFITKAVKRSARRPRCPLSVIPAELVPGPLGEREASFLFLDSGSRPAAVPGMMSPP